MGSQKREKAKSRILRRQRLNAYAFLYDAWLRNEPPRWRIISHWLWKKREPVWRE